MNSRLPTIEQLERMTPIAGASILERCIEAAEDAVEAAYSPRAAAGAKRRLAAATRLRDQFYSAREPKAQAVRS